MPKKLKDILLGIVSVVFAEVCRNNHIAHSGVELRPGRLNVESGNFKMTVLLNDEIVFPMEDVNSDFSVRIAGESAACSSGKKGPAQLLLTKGKESIMKIVVSACLLGRNCKYNGGNNYDPKVAAFVQDQEVIPVCPEVLAGMGTPRIPMEIVDGVLMNRSGENVDAPNRRAVETILAQLRDQEIACAILKSRSPTCGVKQVYDGTFSGTLTQGAGILARALMEAGYRVIDAEDL